MATKKKAAKKAVKRKKAAPKHKKLPNKPSKLIELALKDLELAEKSKNHIIDMGVFCEPDINKPQKCAVCFGGSVMAFSLKASVNKFNDPDDFGHENSCKIRALDAFRSGDIEGGLNTMGIENDKFGLADCVYVVEYQDDRVQFKKDMKKLIKLLTFHGL